LANALQIITAGLAPVTKAQPQSVVENRGGWYPLVRDWFPGAWQQNAVPINPETVKSFHAVFACMTLIASDIAKLRVKLVAQDSDGIWSETTNAAYSPVLRKPNGYQTRIQFWENWVLSKLSRGNTYVLKERDGRGVVVRLYVLDPCRVTPMVTPDGAVYYELQPDNMAGIEETRVMVPGSEIIHDRFNCLFHPLVGVSPIYACGLAATQGLSIQNNSATMFGNGSRPGGLLIAPGRIDPENASRLKEAWDNNYTGLNAGKVAVLGDGMKYEALAVNAVDAQLIEQLKWTAEVVCSTFHVPPYKIGVGALPSYNNVQALNVEYYSQCLQIHIEAAELCLDEGLGIGVGVTTGGTTYGTEFDLDNLLRMDSITQMEMLKNAAGILSPDEMRAKLDKKPVEGGGSPMVQQQNYSLAALAKRDAQADPFGTAAPAPPPANDDEPTEAERAETRAAKIALLEKRVRERLNA
jgi:HK97 family phage portal protein